MTMAKNADPLQEYILTSKKNLHIAATVAEAWPEARDQLVSVFLKRLGVELSNKLKGWKCESDGRYFIDRWPCFSVWKHRWADQYCVTLQCWNFGEKMLFGVTRDEIHIAKRSFCAEILDAVKQIYPSAKSSKWWEAWVTMRSPAADWRNPEVLWNIHTDNTFLKDVAEQFLEVAEVCEPIIDRLVEKNQTK
jgi:hypothetical protein